MTAPGDEANAQSGSEDKTLPQIGVVSGISDDGTIAPDADTIPRPFAARESEKEYQQEDRLSVSPMVGPEFESTRYFGNYELLREIARGGMGVVYKARQINLNRVVALKMILAGQFADRDEVQRFYMEAEAAARLDHWGIVPIYEIGEYENQSYFSMAYIEGESLADQIRRGPLDPYKAAVLLKKICEAMAYAHENGVIHRDLKPANILIDQGGEPKIADFGLAKKLETDSNLTGTGQILGTPAYMPPEQAAGKSDVGPLADLYALGAILYCSLVGRPPFQGANPLETLLQVLDQQPVLPRRLVPTVPIDLESICLKCLEKAPSLRYASAKDLADDLGRFLNGQAVTADGSSTLKRAWSAMLRETRHLEVMENWGYVWLWHAVQIFTIFLLTNVLIWSSVSNTWPYIFLWTCGFASLMVPVWFYRFRRGAPLTPIEWQLGQVWGIFTATVIATGVIQRLLAAEALHLLPFAVLECGMAFGCMAAILGGSFYPMAALCLGLSILLTSASQFGPVVFGVAFGIGLFIPGWKFTRGADAKHTFVGSFFKSFSK